MKGAQARSRSDRAAAERSRRSDPWKAAFAMLLVAGLSAVVAWVLLGSRLLVVRDVDVTGTQRLDPDTVAAAVNVATGTPLARIDIDEAAGSAQELRLVESVQVSREWPATLHVHVTEREPRVSLKVSGGYRIVDRAGVRITDSDSRPENHPLVEIEGEVEGNPEIAEAADIAERLPDPILHKIDEIDADDPEEITLHLEDGASVAWGNSERTEEKSRVLTVLMQEHPSGAKRRYDVSAPGVAVVK